MSLNEMQDVSTGHRTLPSLLSTADPELSSLPVHTAAIALGSNLGDRFANIEQALRLLEAPTHLCDAPIVGDNAEVYIVDTSFMYETAPMYVTDQPSFINCACMVSFLGNILCYLPPDLTYDSQSRSKQTYSPWRF